MAAHSRIRAWRIPWTEEPGGRQSTGLRRVTERWCVVQRRGTIPRVAAEIWHCRVSNCMNLETRIKETRKDAGSREVRVSPSQRASSMSPHVTLLLVPYLSFHIYKNMIINQIRNLYPHPPPQTKESWRSSPGSTESFSFPCRQLQNGSNMDISESI